MSNIMEIYVALGQDSVPQQNEGEKVSLTTNEGTSEESGYIAAVDPRLKNLGIRTIALAGSVEPDGQDISDQLDYDILRVLQGVPEGPSIEQRLPLNINAHQLNGIDLEKGRYVGHEQVSQRHFRG